MPISTGRNLPVRILRAIDAALHLSSIPRCMRATLAEIVRCVSQADPFKTVFAHKKTLAERIGAWESTVYRHLAALESKYQLIERVEQERRSYNGKFAVSRIRLTRLGAELLGLAEPGVIQGSPTPILEAGHIVSEPTNSKNQPAANAATVPADLTRLSAQGMKRQGIFALMGMASAKGKRLSDIVAVKGETLRELRGRRLFGYLRSLAQGPTDFAHAAREARRRAAESEARRIDAARAARWRERFAGCALTDRAQGILHQIDASARFAFTVGKGSRPLTDLAPWIAATESGRLVLATAEAEARLLAAR